MCFASDVSIWKSIGAYRLAVFTYNSSGLLEMLNLNSPAIAFWNPDGLDQIDRDAAPYFARLVDEAHNRGIKVFMDVITNHTADVIQLEGNAGYRNTQAFPYRDVNGQPFDDRDYAYSGQSDYTFPEVDATSFPYVPQLPPGTENFKNPAWLNDPLLYHNRGNTTFSGENSLYGDFFGLDDLWTERREVVEGMAQEDQELIMGGTIAQALKVGKYADA